jgi:hypothetical protein
MPPSKSPTSILVSMPRASSECPTSSNASVAFLPGWNVSTWKCMEMGARTGLGEDYLVAAGVLRCARAQLDGDKKTQCDRELHTSSMKLVALYTARRCQSADA